MVNIFKTSKSVALSIDDFFDKIINLSDAIQEDVDKMNLSDTLFIIALKE